MKTTLIIMAAGIGSRYGGGIKQLAEVGPSGEIIVDYSIHDALEAGFDDVVFIIRKDIEDDFTYDTSKVKAFLLPAGTAVEVYATTLHYAPCGVDGAGFQVAIVLPKGTNYDLPATKLKAEGEDKLITAVNKWLIGHPEGGLAEGSFLGLKGENITL